MSEHHLLTMKQVAEMLGVSMNTVCRWSSPKRKKNRLQRIRISARCIRFSPLHVETFLAEKAGK